MRYITSKDVEALQKAGHVDLSDYIAAVESAYREVGNGTARLLSRQSLVEDLSPEAARPRSFKIMGAALLDAGFMGVVTYPAGYGRPLDFRVVLSSAQSGEALAVIEGEIVTQWATASVTAAATRALSRAESKVLGVIGTGRFAFDQPLAIAKVRPIEEIRCYSRDAGNRNSFAFELAEKLDGVRVFAVDSAALAADGADIVTTVTTAHEPVISSADIRDGMHVNAIGMHYPKTREIDSETMRRAKFFVDDVQQTLEEKGEFIIPQREGLIAESHILGDLGGLLTGKCVGRQSDDDLTLFGSGGTAVEYLGVAAHLYRTAEAVGIGTEVA